jgi:hypothetical protein
MKVRICKTIILPAVLYGCEIWSLTVREEHKLRVFENRVLRRIFGPKRDGVTGGWRMLHNEEIHNMYSSPSIIRITVKPVLNGISRDQKFFPLKPDFRLIKVYYILYCNN